MQLPRALHDVVVGVEDQEHEIGMRNDGVRSFGLACVHVERIFLQRVFRMGVLSPLHVDHVVVRLIELRLREIGQKTFVASMTVDEEHFFAAVTRHLVGGFLQQI